MPQTVTQRKIEPGDIKQLRAVYIEVRNEMENPNTPQPQYLIYRKVFNNIKMVLENFQN